MGTNDAMAVDDGTALRRLADPEAALQTLYEFRSLILQDQADRDRSLARPRLAEAQQVLPLLVDIAERIHPAGIERLSAEQNSSDWGWLWEGALIEVNQLIGILARSDEREQILGPAGPTLAANRLHRWVWNAAADLWDGGHYDSAVHKAALAVTELTQRKLRRLDLDGKDLYSKAFSLDDPQPGAPRLRFPDIDGAEQPKRWTSAHEGAMFLGMGCAQGIRNSQAHPSDDITEQEALEQLAALSVLARWVDECDVDRVDGGAAGE